MNAVRRVRTGQPLLAAGALGLVMGFAVSEGLRGPAFSETRTVEKKPAREAPRAERARPAPSPVVAAGPDFRQVIKDVVASVVTVRSQRTVEVSRSPFSVPSPFEEFFGENFGLRPRGRAPGTDRYVQRGLGSGVIVDDRGHILTNNHVVEGSGKIEVVLPNGRVAPATLKGADAQSDLAVLKVEQAGLEPLPFGRSADLEVGEWVLAVGNPFAEVLAHTVTAGIVSAKGRSNLNLADYEDFIQTDAAINPGNSGGALVNTRGELVGINTAIATGTGGSQGIGFAIPVDMARQIMDTLIRSGKVTRGYIGVTIQDLTPEMAKAAGIEAQKGAIISRVLEDGPAADAGLKQGDVVVEIEGRPVSGKDDLRNQIAAAAPGSRVRLGIERDGKIREVTVALAEMPAQAGSPEGPSGEGSAEQGLGISARTLTPQLADQLGFEADRGVVITEVEPGSAADAAGLRRGDLIKEVNRRPVTSVTEFREQMARRSTTGAVLLLVRRGEDTFYVTLAEP